MTTETPAPAPTETPAPAPTETPEPAPTETSAPAPTETPEPTPTRTPEPVPTDTPAPTFTDTPEATPTDTLEPTQEPTPERTEAQVMNVVDGDTIDVSILGQVYTVRYLGMDAPEAAGPGKPAQWMGPEAREANEQLVGGKTVYLEKDVSETDQHGQLLRYVYLLDGTFVNAELVRLGYAHASNQPPDVKYQDLFSKMEQEAREAGRGLWGPTPVPPTATHLPPNGGGPTQPPAGP
jgi:micrococcal nuclease